MTITVTGRFADPALLNLGPPPALAAQTFEALRAASIAKYVGDMAAIGLTVEVGNLESNPGALLVENGVTRDVLRRRAIDDAIEQTYLGHALGGFLDQRAADYGVLRRPVVVGDLTASPPVVEVLEDDDSLRMRGRLAWEAISVAGPAGAYVFQALDAHPEMFDAAAYGPESEIVDPGEVLVVLQSRALDGVPSPGVVDVVAARLDAFEVIYGTVENTSITNGGGGYTSAVATFSGGGEVEEATGEVVLSSGVVVGIIMDNRGRYRSNPTVVITGDGTGATATASIIISRPVRDDQSVRPLGARVTVKAVAPAPFDVDAEIFYQPGSDPAVLMATAVQRLTDYIMDTRSIGRPVPIDALSAVLYLPDEFGMPTMRDVNITVPSDDIDPGYDGLPVLGDIVLTLTPVA
jgi:phage-related baseplate assembly protein